jgi:hypothetical protein
MRAAASTILACFLLLGTGLAQERFDVFFVAVGSSHYVVPHEDGVTGMENIPGAAKSAEAVAYLLERGGSTFGVTLVSDSSHFVGRDDVFQALSRVYNEIVKTHPARPLVVFYFAGHGVSEGITWNHFSLPGNFAYRGDLSEIVSLHATELESIAIYADTWVPWMMQRAVPFLVLLDTCYEGTPGDFYWKPVFPRPDDDRPCPTDPIGAAFCADLKKRLSPYSKFDDQMAETVKGFNGLADNFRKSNRFENTYPVLFSTEPGSTVQTVADPFNPDPRETAVAPLARRAMLILTPALRRRQSLSLEEFIKEMKSPNLDSLTKAAVNYSPIPGGASLSLVSPNSPRGHFESRVGTAIAPAICCSQP